jgi:amino acid adenylation domain-containing protein
MTALPGADQKSYVVVINDAAQYSLWPAERPLPAGWRATGRSGSRSECLTFVDQARSEGVPAPGSAGEPTAAVEPEAAAERQACAIAADVLGVTRVAPGDNFFARGGDSLLAIRLLERLRAAGWDATPRDVFEAGSVGELGRRLRPARKLHQAPPNGIPPDADRITPEMLTLIRMEQEHIDRLAALVPGGAMNIQDIYPLTPLQEGFVFEHLAAPRADPYVTLLVLRFGSEDAVAQFMRGLHQVVARHDILRTAIFWDVPPRPLQVVLRKATLSVDRCDPARPMTDEELLALGRIQAGQLDLRHAPLARVTTARSAERGWSLLLVIHHVIDDDMLLRNVSSEVRALEEGRTLPPALPFRNFVSFVLSRDLEASETFWRRQLDGVTEPTAPVLQHGATRSTSERCLRGDLAEQIRTTCRACAVTPAALFHLAYAIVLARHSGTDDVVFGTVLSGRSAPIAGLETAAGMFLSTVPVRIRLDGGSVREALSRVHALLAELPDHEHVPLPRIQSWSSIRPPTPLFSALLNVRHLPAGVDPLLLDARAEEMTHYSLSMSVSDVGDGYEASLQTAGEGGEEVVEHFARAVASIAADVRQPLDAVDLQSATERRRILAWSSSGPSEFPDDAPLAALVEEQVARAPGAIAVEFDGEQFTYGELDRRANQLAHHLRALGVGTETPVAICVDRSAEMVVGLLAILKAGGAYVPLDPTYPAERLAFMLEDAAAPVLLTQERHAGRVPLGSTRVVRLDADWPAIAATPSSAVVRAVGGQNLAYVMYTSGSTGRPKGVCVPQRAVHRLVRGTNYAPLGPGDRVAQVSNISFDAATFEVWGALANGACLVGVGKELALSPAAFARALVDRDISAIFLTAALFAGLVREIPGMFRTVGSVLFGGDAADPDAVRLALRSGAPRLVNAYGPTETTTFACFHEVRSVAPNATSIPIGRPIAHTTVYVLDDRLEPVPVGVAGELYVGGPGVARGYWARRALTAERFVPDPFSTERGARLYRTGDLCRWLSDGTIQFLGRVDRQVKIRGFRVELGEIEAVLKRHAGVREAVVVAREDEPGRKRLVAYAVGDEGRERDVREQLSRALPEYMLPSAFVWLPAIPLSPNGKVDRAALPTPEARDGRGTRRATPPRTRLEEVVASTWSEVLGVAAVGVDDDFFELGGHSLLAMQVTSRLRAALGIEVPVRALFQARTLAAFAASLASMGPGAIAAPPLTPRGGDGPAPASFAQQRLWFLDQLDPGSASYNVPLVLRLEGPLDVEALRWSLETVVRRHEVLRTTLSAVRGEAVQVVHPASCPLPVVDLRALDPERRRADAQARPRAEILRAFDLGRGPLLRAELLRLADEEHLLVLVLHHIVADGWSMAVLLGELSASYDARCAGRRPALPELPVQYADYAGWERSWLQGPALEAQLEYWRDRLAGLSALDLPADRPRPRVQSHRGAERGFVLDAELTSGLRRFSNRAGVTIYMTLVAAFETLLHRHSGQLEFGVGTPIANRSDRQLEGLIGFFANTLVLRADLRGDPTFDELLGRVREDALGAYAHQAVPFEQVVDELGVERDLGSNPLFQAMFVLQNAAPGGLAMAGLRVRDERVPLETSKFDLTLTIREERDGLVGSFEYATDLFDPATMERMAAHFRTLLVAAVRDPDTRVSALPLLGDDERQQLARWNATQVPREPTCLHALLEAQARRTPDAVAVRYEGERLTYLELDERANGLAHRLAALGVGPEVRVAVFAERSLELVTALCAVLKAGGAYVPVDPGYPRERVEFLVRDARAAVVLAQERLLATLPPVDAAVVPLEAACADRAAAPPRTAVRPDNAAYVIYTSGSTGTPKGAVNTHRGICNRLEWMQARYRLDARDRVLQKTPYGFDVSVWEFFWPLLAGAQLVVARPGGHEDSAYLVDLIEAAGVTTVHFVPSMLAAFLEEPGFARCRALRGVICSGEALRWEHQQRFLERLPAVELHNLYGPTEAAVDVTSWACEPDGAPGVVPIGRPIDNIQIHILDERLEPVPVGVSGELYIAGVGLARGYLGRPALTAERFVPNPHGEPGSRLYRTGDIARWLATGAIEYQGRNDDQVKLRGFRIELGEIESALASHSAVRAAAVVAREHGGDRRLVAYVVAASPLDPSALREHLAAKLPDYMVPSAFVLLDALPLTPNGKLDRRALPTPDTAPRERTFVPPRDDLERRVVAVWENVLGVTPIGVQSSFFELGGHSLLALRLMAEIRLAFARDVPLPVLFKAPTVEGMANHLRAEPVGTPWSPLVSIETRGSDPAFFCVHPIGGHVLCYLELARALRPPRPFHALQAIGMDRGQEPLETVEDMAALYVKAIRSTQPSGPYFVGGWSSGGTIAYEIAQQLRRDGDAIGRLVLLDSDVRITNQVGPDPDLLSAPFARVICEELFGRELARDDEELSRMTEDELLQLVVDESRKAHIVIQDVGVDQLRAVRRTFAAGIRAMARYVPRPYDGPAALIQVAERDDRAEQLRAWADLVRAQIDCQCVPGDHYSMMRPPFVQHLASALTSQLRHGAGVQLHHAYGAAVDGARTVHGGRVKRSD